VDDSEWLRGLFLLVFIFVVGALSYHIGKTSTIHKVLVVLEQEENVSTDSISIESIREEVLNIK
jgi:hypothetical protein